MQQLGVLESLSRRPEELQQLPESDSILGHPNVAFHDYNQISDTHMSSISDRGAI